MLLKFNVVVKILNFLNYKYTLFYKQPVYKQPLLGSEILK